MEDVSKELKALFARVKEAERTIVALPEQLQGFVDAVEAEREPQRVKLLRSTAGLRAAMGIIKATATDEQKASLATVLKQVKSEAAPKKRSDACGAAARQLEAARRDVVTNVTTTAIFARAPPQAVNEAARGAAAAFDDEVQQLQDGGDVLLHIGDEIVHWWSDMDASQAEVAENSFVAIVTLVKQTGSAEQKQKLADALKSVPKTFPEDGNDASRVYNWRAAIRRVQVVRPNPLPVLDALDAMQDTLTPKPAPARLAAVSTPVAPRASVSTPVAPRVAASPPPKRAESAPADDDNGVDDDGMAAELVTEGVAFSESFHVEDADAVKVAAVTARGNVCPICRGDFFSAEEMVAHLKIGCKPPPAAPVVHVEVAEAEPDGDHSDEDGAPKTATDRFLKKARSHVRRLSSNKGPGSPAAGRHGGGERELVIGAPTDVTHDATADARGNVKRLDKTGAPATPAAQRNAGSAGAPLTPAAARSSAAPSAAATPSTPAVQRDVAPSIYVTPASATAPLTAAVASPAPVGTPGSRRAVPPVPNTPGVTRTTQEAPRTPAAGDRSSMPSSALSVALTAKGASETVLDIQGLRVDVGAADSMGAKLKANRAKVRVVFRVGTHQRSTTAIEMDVPGCADFSMEPNLSLPFAFHGLPVSIHVFAKGVEAKRTSSTSSFDKIGRPKAMEMPLGCSRETSAGSLAQSARAQTVAVGAGADGSGAQVCTVSFTAVPLEQESLAVVARRCIAPRMLPAQSEAIKSVESAKLLMEKLVDFRRKDAPSRWKAQPPSGDAMRDAAEAWPPRVDEVCRLVRQGYRCEAPWKNWRSQTILHLACMAGDVVAMKMIMRLGVEEEPQRNPGVDDALPVRKPRKPHFSVSDRDDQGMSSWMVAVAAGHLDVVRELYNIDADTANLTLYSLDAMHVAACANDVAMVKYLFGDLHKTLDIKDQNGATPLFYAAYAGHTALVELLCEYRCFVDVEDSQSQSPILMALEGGHSDVARVLMRHKADLNAYNLRGDNAIWLCILRGQLDLLAELVLSGRCEINAGLERHRNTLLHKLVLFVDDEAQASMMLAALLGHGGKVDSLNAEKKTPLHLACALSRQKMVTLLLNSGANAKARDCHENTPLHFAFLPAVCEALVDRGASVDAVNLDDNTPMHIMSAFGMMETVSCLRALGAKESRNKNGNQPSDVFNIVPPKDWFICLPFFAEDESAAASGGVVLRDKPRSENAAQVAGAKNKARNSLKQFAAQVKKAGKDISDSMK